MIRYLDVCSGYSAFTLASAGLGFQCVGYSEIEAFPRAILEQRHGAAAVEWDHRHRAGANSTPLFGDFTQIEAHHVGPVDLLAGGTPCQAFSVAGKRLGLDDPRGNLTLEFLALARRVRAPWLVWENVPGFLSHDGGRTMGTFLRLLGQLGYGWAYRVLDAQYIRVDGFEGAVPQRRRRLFVVAHLGDAAGPAAVLFERESLRGNPAPRREAGQGIARPLGAGSKSNSGYRNDADTIENLITGQPGHVVLPDLQGDERPDLVSGVRMVRAFGGGNRSGAVEAAACLTARGHKCDFEVETFIAQVAGTLPAGGNATGGDRQPGTSAETAGTMLIAGPAFAIHSDALDRSGEGANGTAAERAGLGVQSDVGYAMRAKRPDAVAYRITPNNGAYETGDIAGSLTTGTDRSAQALVQPVAFSVRGRDGEPQAEVAPDGLAPSLRTVGGGSSHAFVADQWAVRRLTPTECERLMGVPDGFTAITYRGKPAADGPRYKALGNSQAVNCMRWIAHGIADVMAAQAAAA